MQVTLSLFSRLGHAAWRGGVKKADVLLISKCELGVKGGSLWAILKHIYISPAPANYGNYVKKSIQTVFSSAADNKIIKLHL